ncbi:MAG: hypothetical protein JWP50_2747 [Phenylobacterium sp.]|nr:hypothetical protein [Phenylobacterium sp.]
MAAGYGLRRPSFFVLCIGLVVATALFGAPIPLAPPVRWALSAGLLAVMGLAGWKAGLELMGASAAAERKALAAAGLLILPVALFALMPGFGPPEFADHARNAFRYPVLFMDALIVFGAMMLLHDVLQARGELLYSRLGFALIGSSTPLYLVWAALLVVAPRAVLAGHPWAVGPWSAWLMSFSDILLFFAGLLTYAATALFVLSMRRTQWLGAKTAAALLVVSLLAVLCLIIRGMDFPDPAVVFAQGYSIPGWIAGIPAVPWLMPCLFGLILIRRIAREAEPASAAMTAPVGLSAAR